MYIVERIFDDQFTYFDTVEKAEAVAKERAGRYGYNYRAAVCKIEKIVGTASPCVEYVEMTADEYAQKMQQSKERALALGFSSADELYD